MVKEWNVGGFLVDYPVEMDHELGPIEPGQWEMAGGCLLLILVGGGPSGRLA